MGWREDHIPDGVYSAFFGLLFFNVLHSPASFDRVILRLAFAFSRWFVFVYCAWHTGPALVHQRRAVLTEVGQGGLVMDGTFTYHLQLGCCGYVLPQATMAGVADEEGWRSA